MLSVLNTALKPLGVEVTKLADPLKPWDRDFIEWVAKAKAADKDPNDFGDESWGKESLDRALDSIYLPNIKPDDVVLEIGPGTGRLTRYLIGKCREFVFVDYSPVVIEFISEYMKGKAAFRTVLTDIPGMPAVADASVDVALANGVFVHVDPDDLCWFICDIGRVLKPGGVAIFSYNNIMWAEWLEFYKEHRGKPGDTCLFRFYHPEVIGRYAECAGLVVETVVDGDTWLPFVALRKPD
jgi:SAM-dependent methyltransferase